MHTVSGATKARAGARGRVARARRAQRLVLRAPLGRENPLGVAGVGLALALVLGSALVQSQFAPFTLRLSGLFGRAPAPHTDFTGTGAIVFTPFDGNDCRKVLFSNRTGWFGPDQHVRCDTSLAPEREDAAPRAAGPAERMNSIRAAFTSRSAR